MHGFLSGIGARDFTREGVTDTVESALYIHSDHCNALKKVGLKFRL